MSQSWEQFHGKKILLGVSASIAAYKSAHLIRLMVKAGAEVRVVMTPEATEFIGPLTLATLSKHPVHSDFTEDREAGTWVNHVELGLWADLFLIAPCTANTLAKMVSGAADNLLLAVYLSARCPVAIAPAMDLDMFSHASTQANLSTLQKRGNSIIDAEEGELASGLSGKGRMAEPEHIMEQLHLRWRAEAPLFGKRVLVTAGPTYEAIDAVRFIGNHSSGKMGYALADSCARKGAEVVLISGPSHLVPSHPAVSRNLKRIRSAAEMLEACLEEAGEADIIIMAAAVADYTIAEPAKHKLKKSDGLLELQLSPTVDILKTLGEQKKKGQILVGFALETDNEKANAEGKLKRKNLDIIVLNSLKDPGAGFGHDTNRITLIDAENKMRSFELKSKAEVAEDILQKILELCE